MTTDLQTRLARLSNYRTRYEIIIRNITTGESVLLCYATRFGKSHLRRCAFENAERVVALTGVKEMNWDKTFQRWTIGDWEVRRSGRTQREAFISGELRWIKD